MIRFNTLGQRKLGSLLQYTLLLLNTLVGIMFTPFMVHKLGQAEYGLYQLVYSFAGYLAILDFGIATTVTRYVSKFRSNHEWEQEENYLFMVLLQTFIFSFSVFLIGGILYFSIDNFFSGSLTQLELLKAKKLYIMMVINMGITLIDHFFWGTHLSREQFTYNAAEKIVRILLRTVLLIILLQLGFDSIALTLVNLSLTVSMLICDAFFSFAVLKIKIKFHYWDKSLFRESFVFAFFIFLQAIVNQITMNTDKVILGVMTSTTVVAVYAVAMQIFSIYNSLSTAIQSVFLPKATTLVHTGSSSKEITEFVSRPARFQFMILGLALVGFCLVGKEFIICWMGIDYLSAFYIALIIMIPGTVELTENVMVSVVLAKNKNGFRTGVLAGVSIFNVILTIIMVKLWGFMGAPIATALAYLIGNILVMNIYYHRVIKIDVFYFIRAVLKGTAAALLLTALISYPLISAFGMSGWLGFILDSALILAVYVVLMLVFGLNAEEKTFVMKFLGK